MFRFCMIGLCILMMGCSTAPITGLMDWLRPSRPRDYFPGGKPRGDSFPVQPELKSPQAGNDEKIPSQPIPEPGSGGTKPPEPDPVSKKPVTISGWSQTTSSSNPGR
jgi:hypothetical protein